MKLRRKITGLAIAAIVILLIAMVMAANRTRATVVDAEVPVTTVKSGDFQLGIQTTGELRASHSMMLSAPPIGGGVLQITRLLRSGTADKKGEIVLEFNPSEQQYKLEQSRSELLQAEQEIIKAKADAAVQTAQDKVALLKARFDVRRAQLDVGKNELVSSIDAQKNNLALEQAKRALAQLEQDFQSHTASGQATIVLASEKRNKAQLAMRQAQENIEKMQVRAPMDGVLAIERNVDSAGGMFWGGMSLPDYREGDQTQPGNNIARVIDPSKMELVAKVEERERGNIKAGQSAEIRLDAMPGTFLPGTVKSVASMVVKNFWEDDSGGKFETLIDLPPSDARIRPGLTAQVVIVGEKRNNVLIVPRQALFLKDGKRVAYVKSNGSFEAQEVRVKAETESRAAIEGLKAGLEVALLDPTAPKKSAQPSAAEPSIGGAR